MPTGLLQAEKYHWAKSQCSIMKRFSKRHDQNEQQEHITPFQPANLLPCCFKLHKEFVQHGKLATEVTHSWSNTHSSQWTSQIGVLASGQDHCSHPPTPTPLATRRQKQRRAFAQLGPRDELHRINGAHSADKLIRVHTRDPPSLPSWE